MADSTVEESSTPESGRIAIFLTPVYNTSSCPSRLVVEQPAAESATAIPMIP